MFNRHKPIILGVNVKEGVLKTGTPVCVPDKGNLYIGKVTSMEVNKKPVGKAVAKDGDIAIKIEGDSSIQVGRHFDESNQIVSMLSRKSIDALKMFYKDDLSKEDWLTVIKLKKVLGIQ